MAFLVVVPQNVDYWLGGEKSTTIAIANLHSLDAGSVAAMMPTTLIQATIHDSSSPQSRRLQLQLKRRRRGRWCHRLLKREMWHGPTILNFAPTLLIYLFLYWTREKVLSQCTADVLVAQAVVVTASHTNTHQRYR